LPFGITGVKPRETTEAINRRVEQGYFKHFSHPGGKGLQKLWIGFDSHPGAPCKSQTKAPFS